MSTYVAFFFSDINLIYLLASVFIKVKKKEEKM